MFGFETRTYQLVGYVAHAGALGRIVPSRPFGEAQGPDQHVTIAQVAEHDGGPEQPVERALALGAKERGAVGLARTFVTIGQAVRRGADSIRPSHCELRMAAPYAWRHAVTAAVSSPRAICRSS